MMGIRSRARGTLDIATDGSLSKGDDGLGGEVEVDYVYGPIYVGRREN